ncbi:hypothetical protein ACFLSW_05210 [Candidatus Bipolaricaulota bacterium]
MSKISRNTKTRLSKNIIIAFGVIVIVVAAVIVGALLLDSPAQERLRRLDERRVSDLAELGRAVSVYWTQEGSLPSSLNELTRDREFYVDLSDPETGNPYEYRVVDDTTYELCAVFARETGNGDRNVPYGYLWFHGSGRQCLQLEAHDVNWVQEYR